jgi:hypothetical protein
VEQEIRIVKFFQGCGEGLHEIFWQIPDKSHSICNNDLPLTGKPKPTAARIQGLKKAILHRHLAVSKGVQ